MVLQDHQPNDPDQQVPHGCDIENSFVLFSSTERTQFCSDSATIRDQNC